ncbi:MAG: dethiobiotin synthase [Rickettsiales bacterium]|nr:dethiobiotin synthase [Rickettsiales bacterium]
MTDYFISATGTEIGKTFLLENLISNLIKSEKKVNAIKPIISGINENNFYESDSYKIAKALSDEVITYNSLKNISPFQFEHPLSPDQAAKLINKKISYLELLNFTQDFLENNKKNDFNFIEGVGGVYVPINQQKLVLNLIEDLNIKLILVSNNYLGCLSHTLSIIKNLPAIDIKLFFNNYPYNDNLIENINSLQNFTDIEIYTNIDDLIQNL